MKKNEETKKEKIFLTAEERKIFGKKVKQLRKNKKIPANIFGQKFKSQAIIIDLKEFIKVYKIVKETGIVYIKIKDEEVPVLIKNIQRHPITDNLFHVDFRKIDLKQKIETEVPIKIIGSSPAVTEKNGVLITQLDNILVAALPENLPSEIVIDITNLKEIGQEIKVADLPKNKNYEIITPKEKIIVSVIAHKEESIKPETTVITAEKIEKEEKEEEKKQSTSSQKEEGTQTSNS